MCRGRGAGLRGCLVLWGLEYPEEIEGACGEKCRVRDTQIQGGSALSPCLHLPPSRVHSPFLSCNGESDFFERALLYLHLSALSASSLC